MVRFVAPILFVLMQRYCVNLETIRYESTSVNRIATDKSRRVIVALIYRLLFYSNSLIHI